METSNNWDHPSPKEHDPCIWMQAGIVRRKLCNAGYHCSECRYDRALRRVVEDNKKLGQSMETRKRKRFKIVHWKDKLRNQPPWKRPCVHHLKGHIGFRTCNEEYRCRDCEFDQYFYDQYAVHTILTPVEVFQVKGFKVPHGYYFHRGHTWVRLEEGPLVRVGMDDFALRLFGPLDRIESPLIGKQVKQDRPEITITRGSKQAKALSPVSGVVTSINSRVREQGNLANEDPFSGGWIMMVHADDLAKDIKNLMINRETRDFMEGQIERLHGLIEDVEGPLTADGGHFGHDIYGNMPRLGWNSLSRIFLGTTVD